MDLSLELGDPAVEVLDVARELADAAGGCPFGQTVAELQLLQPPEHLRPVAADGAGLGDRIELRPVSPQPLDRLRAVADEAASLQLERCDRPDDLWFERWPELRSLAANDVGNRERVTGIGFARTEMTTLAVRAPGRDVQDLEPDCCKSGDK